MLTAIEPSADALGASLIGALRARLGPNCRFVGVGGPAMVAEGLASAFDPSGLGVVGVFNAIGAWAAVRRRVREVAELARREEPDVAVLIDSWAFSIRMARALRRLQPRPTLVKYAAPQVWATRPGRARVLAKAFDRLLTLNAFEVPYFERWGLSTRFVSSPALARPAQSGRPETFRLSLDIGPDDPLLLILPGSRVGEVRRLMPRFGDAVRRLREARPNLRVVVAAAQAVDAEVRRLAAAWPISDIRTCDPRDRFLAMGAATLALACSGTVTSELAMAGCPMVVAYRLDPLTYLVAKLLLRTPYITLLNVVAGGFVVPERVQGRCTGAVLARDLEALLADPKRRAAQAKAQAAAVDLLRGGIEDPVGAAADGVVEALKAAKASQPRDSSCT